jgi:hypothetical protein
MGCVPGGSEKLPDFHQVCGDFISTPCLLFSPVCKEGATTFQTNLRAKKLQKPTASCLHLRSGYFLGEFDFNIAV